MALIFHCFTPHIVKFPVQRRCRSSIAGFMLLLCKNQLVGAVRSITALSAFLCYLSLLVLHFESITLCFPFVHDMLLLPVVTREFITI